MATATTDRPSLAELQARGRPTAIVARTIKGYPIQTLLTADPNHHGKPLTRDETQKALAVLA